MGTEVVGAPDLVCLPAFRILWTPNCFAQFWSSQIGQGIRGAQAVVEVWQIWHGLDTASSHVWQWQKFVAEVLCVNVQEVGHDAGCISRNTDRGDIYPTPHWKGEQLMDEVDTEVRLVFHRHRKGSLKRSRLSS